MARLGYHMAPPQQTGPVKTRPIVALLFLLALVASLSTALPASQGKSKEKGKGKEDSGQSAGKKGGKADSDRGSGAGGGTGDEAGMAPLFKGKLGLKSSSQSKDQATLGFNGADDEGNIRAEVLKAQPGPEDERQAQLVAHYEIKPDDVQAFVRGGKLKEKPPEKSKLKSQ